MILLHQVIFGLIGSPLERRLGKPLGEDPRGIALQELRAVAVTVEPRP